MHIARIFLAALLVHISVSVPLKNISDHPVVLVVSFDGFRYDYLNKVHTPTLNELKKRGVSVPYMEPVFPTKTFPNHQSIATGLYAESHGVVGNTFFDLKYNRTLNVNDSEFWNYSPDVLPIWILNEIAGGGRTSGCLMWPGSNQPYGFKNDSLPTYYYPTYNASVPWEDRVDIVISWITDKTKPANLVFLYFEEPDTHGHAFGPNHQETLNEISNTDNRTAYLIRKLKEVGIFDKINLILLSDHGMEAVTQDKIINITALIDTSLLKARYGSTPVVQLIANEGKGEELFTALSNHSKNYGFKILTKEEARYRFHYGQSRRILDYVLIADSGYAFDDFNLLLAKYNKKLNLTDDPAREYGVHGYSPEAQTMRGFFIAHGPAFRKGFVHQPIRNIDIVPLIGKLLKFPSVPSNGSLEWVVDMLKFSFI
ncbi:Ectonucleotide pyrophosphatase/phosphodiesterase family member 5 [Orchesella cincta]|uniref:Ectonucleotide pyrophosphatase/phosphodiesterase family member 5 n=1 Tax=Orchesella cincta TaxID=48709 RepID=A0A1D2M959_ORCCI|nr:Ectonucleotide pyrophosphatase/phosphodiesterase family member 5 [Orchesella cincta]